MGCLSHLFDRGGGLLSICSGGVLAGFGAPPLTGELHGQPLWEGRFEAATERQLRGREGWEPWISSRFLRCVDCWGEVCLTALPRVSRGGRQSASMRFLDWTGGVAEEHALWGALQLGTHALPWVFLSCSFLGLPIRVLGSSVFVSHANFWKRGSAEGESSVLAILRG